MRTRGESQFRYGITDERIDLSISFIIKVKKLKKKFDNINLSGRSSRLISSNCRTIGEEKLMLYRNLYDIELVPELSDIMNILAPFKQ